MLFETWFDPSYARKSFIPLTNETLALGSSSVRWSNVYSKVFNVSDGTRLGVLQSNSNGVEVGSTSNHNLRFLLANTAVAQWIYGASDPTLRFIGNGVISNTDNTQVLSIGAGSSAINTTGAHLIFIGNSYGGAGAGNASIGTGNVSGANFDIGVWSTNGSFRVYVNSASQIALAVNSARNLLLYNGVIFQTDDPTILYSTDASSVAVGGGSSIADTSGAGLVLYGISHATKTGGFILGTANSSTAFGDFRAPHASGYHTFSVGGSEVFKISSSEIKLAQKTNYTATMANSTKVVGTDAPADWVEIKIGGTQYFLPAYAA